MPSTKVAATSTLPTRRNRDANVMATAIEVMSERGYAATTIQEVADRVGVLKGSLYHYFSSKEELLFRILEEAHKENLEIVAQVRALELSAIEELLEYLRRSSAWYLENTDRANIFFTESRHLTGERLEKARVSGRNYERYVQELITKAQAEGEVRDDLEDRLIARFVLGTVNSIRSWPSRSGKQFGNEVIVESFVELVRSAIEAAETV